MPATVVREGRLLYHSGEDGWIVEPVDKTFDTAQWMGKARSDLRSAEVLLTVDPPLVGNALYHCQQAAEKARKALLYWQDVPFHKTRKLEQLGVADDPELEQGRVALALAREVYDAVAQRLPPDAIGL